MAQQNWILLALVGAVLIYEASAIKCVVCNSAEANCVDGTKPSEECPAGVTSCYLRMANNLIDRGCLPAAEEASCPTAEGSSCIKCTTEGCNKQTWQQCHQCPTTDTTCADAKTVTGTLCKIFKTNDKCYERFVDGKVERGCESDVTPATNDVCQGNEQCNSCTVADCNSHAGREFQVTKCVQCVTSNDAEGKCLDGSQAATNCAQPSDGKCYSKVLEDGTLKRGCHSELTAAEVTACTGATCTICSEEAGCNKGTFPADRLQCYQCQKTDDASCAEDQTTEAKSKICKLYKADDKCYSRVKLDLSFDRGCQSDLPDSEKSCPGLENCFECSTKNCNSLSEQKLKDSTKCQRCNSDDAACLAGSAPSQSCGQVGDTCFARLNNGKLERNCLLSLSAADQAKCNNAQDQSCVTCSGQGCNAQKWIKCHQCKESTSTACKAAQQDATAEFCPNYKAENQCYERLESEKVVRGCANDLSEAACKDNLECRTCSDSACNKAAADTLKTDQRCLQCSTTSDAGGLCLAGTAATQPCKTASNSKCFSQIQADGHLKRGCQGDLTATEIVACTGDLCKICDTAGCNTGLFPLNRLKCYQCKSSVDETCKDELQDDGKSGYCKLFVAQDKCYSRDANNIFERGCQSDLGLTADACTDLDEKHCNSCDAANCNVISKEKLNGAGTVALNVVLVVVAAFAAIAGL